SCRKQVRADEKWHEARRMQQRVHPRDATRRVRRLAWRLGSGHAIETNRVLDVLELLYAQVLEREIELLVDLLVNRLRHADAARARDRLQSRRDVHAIAVDVVILHDHIAKVYADSGLHPLGWRAAGVGDRLGVLDRLRTAPRVDPAVELAEHGVTRRVDD